MQEFIEHRTKLLANMAEHSIAIIPAARVKYRNSQIEYPFRQDSNFYYLTGYNEPDAICVLVKAKANTANKFIFFILPERAEEKVWTGMRLGLDKVKIDYGADEVYSVELLEEIMPQLLKNKQLVYFAFANAPLWGKKIMRWMHIASGKLSKKARAAGEKITYIPTALQDITPILGELRLIKTAYELQQLKQAAVITSNAHSELMRVCKPGIYEYQLAASFIHYCLQRGCQAVAYPAIVAGGENACILHYSKNTRQLQAGDLVVIDAGGEYNYYAADITRTLPVSGKFNDQQKSIYNLVLQAQLAGLAEIKPGNMVTKVQEVIVKTLVTGMVELGILQGEVSKLITEQAYKQYYMHNSGHWLGLDVHDVGEYYVAGEPRTFVEGMVLTIEPGLYIGADAAASQWRGIGVRIEDMVLVTKEGNEVLTKALPKTVADIEHAMDLKS